MHVHGPYEAAAPVLREAMVSVRTRHPRLDVRALSTGDDPVAVLREHARTAATVVLGTERAGTRRTRAGPDSVVSRIIAHADCPVVVVNDTVPVGRPDRLVVGVDIALEGRRHAATAVDHAVEEAARRGIGLRAVHVWRPPFLGVLDEWAAVRECRGLLAALV
ncbi:universal stress protein [Streptomyces sp. NPDC023723]|uniref:universal stress protein n=1 Tax=Streptomyces sp. NPDC023723 TaxID=3154323 RepID=UPI0034003038